MKDCLMRENEYGPAFTELSLHKLITQSIGKTKSIKNICDDSCLDTDDYEQCSVCYAYVDGDYLTCRRSVLCNECFQNATYTLIDWIETHYKYYNECVVNEFIAHPSMLHKQYLQLSDEERAELPAIYGTHCTYDDLRKKFDHSLILKRLQVDLDAWYKHGEVRMLNFSTIRAIVENNILFRYTEKLETIRKASKLTETGNKRKRREITYKHLKKWIPSITMDDIRAANEEQEVVVRDREFLTSKELLKFFASKK